jgi:hypothetical protein
MNRIEFYKAAMAAGAFKTRAWVIAALSLVSEDFSKWTTNKYPYRIVQNSTGFFFCDPDKDLGLTQIDDAVIGKPLFHFRHPIQMKSGEMINLHKDIDTTIGSVFFNYCSIIHAFGDKVDYIEGMANIGAIEELIVDRLEDDGSKVPGAIFVSEYLKFVNSVSYLTNFTQLCVWAATEKSMTAPPGVVEYKNSLLEKYKDRLHDPATIATIDAELVKFDAEYLKGDPAENFLISKKSRNIVRKKLFLMHGAETGLSEGVGVDLIKNSLSQGWEIDKFASMNNSLRAGSFNRGAETQLGGESVKWLLRASSNITATIEDCGTTMGRDFIVRSDNLNKLVGFNIIEDSKPKMITNEEEAGKYLGKTLIVRSPMYCRLDKTDYCLVCVGKRLAQNPTAISMAVSEYGSAFLSLFMAAAHAKALLLAKMDYKQAIT